MIRTFTEHGTNHAKVIRMLCGLGKKAGNPQAAFAMLRPFPGAGHQLILAGVENTANLVLLFFDGIGNLRPIELD